MVGDLIHAAPAIWRRAVACHALSFNQARHVPVVVHEFGHGWDVFVSEERHFGHPQVVGHRENRLFQTVGAAAVVEEPPQASVPLLGRDRKGDYLQGTEVVGWSKVPRPRRLALTADY